jgi:hypothetical protein
MLHEAETGKKKQALPIPPVQLAIMSANLSKP